jgi:hypothetical protein
MQVGGLFVCIEEQNGLIQTNSHMSYSLAIRCYVLNVKIDKISFNFKIAGNRKNDKKVSSGRVIDGNNNQSCKYY